MVIKLNEFINKDQMTLFDVTNDVSFAAGYERLASDIVNEVRKRNDEPVVITTAQIVDSNRVGIPTNVRELSELDYPLEVNLNNVKSIIIEYLNNLNLNDIKGTTDLNLDNSTLYVQEDEKKEEFTIYVNLDGERISSKDNLRMVINYKEVFPEVCFRYPRYSSLHREYNVPPKEIIDYVEKEEGVINTNNSPLLLVYGIGDISGTSLDYVYLDNMEEVRDIIASLKKKVDRFNDHSTWYTYNWIYSLIDFDNLTCDYKRSIN